MAAIEVGILDFEDVVKGDLFDVSFDIEDIDLTGKTLLMQVKKDDTLIIEFKESDNSLTKTVVSTVKTSVRIIKTPTLMNTVTVSVYPYSIIMYTAADDEQTIVEGNFYVVTKIAKKPTS